MLNLPPLGRPLLKRRDSALTPLQASFDGASVMLLLYRATIWKNGIFSMPYVVLMLLLMGVMGITYDRFAVYRSHNGFLSKLATIAKAWTTAFLVLGSVAFLSKQTAVYSRAVVLITFIGGFCLQAALHWLFQVLHKAAQRDDDKDPALIVGTGLLPNYLYDKIQRNPWVRERIIGAVSVGEASPDGSDTSEGPQIVGSLEDVPALAAQHDIRTVYIAVPLDASPVIEQVHEHLLDHNVNIHWVPNIFALKLINHSVKELAGLPIITLSETPLTGVSLLIKEIEDRTLALLATLAFGPLMLALAIAIKLDSPGPVFFRQPRTGWDGEVFDIWKFRSMHTGEVDADKVKQATRDDHRVTRVGRFIRRTSLDELPQLLNVLAGHMSLVGPRPHAVQHNAEYAEQINAYMARHRIKPGMTGLAQVRGYRGETQDLAAMRKRVESDIEYINNWSVWLDGSILLRTVLALFQKRSYENAY